MEARRPSLTVAEFDEMLVIVSRRYEDRSNELDRRRLVELVERSRADVQAGYIVREDYVQGRPNPVWKNWDMQ